MQAARRELSCHADLESEMIAVGSLVVVGATALTLAAGAEAAVVDLEAA